MPLGGMVTAPAHDPGPANDRGEGAIMKTNMADCGCSAGCKCGADCKCTADDKCSPDCTCADSK